jgi:short-subunit dehydrogenase
MKRSLLIALAAAGGALYLLRRLRPPAFPLNTPHPGTALITGASSGIGATYARALAARGYNLILHGRSEERLLALSEELQARHAIRTRVWLADLSQDAAMLDLAAKVESEPDLTLLINNAGYANEHRFLNAPSEAQAQMLQVHVETSIRLTHAALPGMLARGRGAVINVASMAGFVPYPGNETYGATKAYLIHFTESLALELAGKGVQVQALCPGFVPTDFMRRMNPSDLQRIPKFLWLDVERVVRNSLAGLERGDVVVVPGLRYQLISFFARSPLFRPIVKRVTQEIF